MKHRLVAMVILCCIYTGLQAQKSLHKERIKLFVDCKTWCDMTFLRSELTLVDFVLDNTIADVYVMVTKQQTGGGGKKFQLIFLGQNRFAALCDTVYFDTDANATDFEERADLSNEIKIGLMPYIAQTTAVNNVIITYKKAVDEQGDIEVLPTHDPWNYWVITLSANGSYSSDEIYKNFNYNSRIGASRVTDKIKTSFNVRMSRNKKSYILSDATGDQKIVVINNDYSMYHQLVKSMGPHWSYGYEVNVSQSNFSNNKLRIRFSPAIEYDVYPYKAVNTKFLTIRYGLDMQQRNYFDTTIYNKTKEFLVGQGLNVYLSLKQRWGNTSIGLHGHNFINNMAFYNVGLNANVDVRITGGLSFYLNVSGAIVRDQLSLVKGTASEQDILIQRRQLASGYNFWTNFGINYRFGSKLNNFVNPRFN